MNSKYTKQKWFLSTELLPSEIPNFFSNFPIIKSLDDILDKHLQVIEKKQREYTVPLKFEIQKNNHSTRAISIIHPWSQLVFLLYIMKYEYLLINFLQKSKFNARRICKINKITYNERKVLIKKRNKIEQDFGISESTTISNEELDKFFKKYFAYNKHHNLSGVFNTPSFRRDSHKFRYFLKLDIQNFFDSIYTHSLTWAIVGDKNIGKTYSRGGLSNTFASQTDIVQQRCNYNETNGIIIGPELNRVFADIILTQCDYMVEKNLKNLYNLKHEKNYKIYRFVDDYYIFSSKHETIEQIETEITKELSNYNLQLNCAKYEIKEQPFSLADRSITQLKHIITLINTEREISLLKSKAKDNEQITKYEALFDLYQNSTSIENHRISSSKILIRKSTWNNLHDSIQNIIDLDNGSKRRVILYFLKSISVEIYEPIFIKSSRGSKKLINYIHLIYTVLDNITNIYSIHPDSDTTKAYINLILKLRSTMVKLRKIIDINHEYFYEESIQYLIDIENRIFENIFRIIKFNKSNTTNISDLIVYLKTFSQKLNTQFLCKILEYNKDDYFTLCSVAYYIKGNYSRYRVVLKFLFKIIRSFIEDYQVTKGNKLYHAKYFYILNDFCHYPDFEILQIESETAKEILERIKDDELVKIGTNVSPIFKYLMENSYYNWDLSTIDFERLQINKIITNNINSMGGIY